MRTSLFTIFLFSLLFLLSNCDKPAENESFLQMEWKIQSIVDENGQMVVPSDQTHHHRKDAYILRFCSDSCFFLATSVNEAGGNYKIVSEKRIMINKYQEWTKVYNVLEHQRNFDERLISIFHGLMFYSYTRNKLILRGEQNKEIVFVKQNKN